MNHFFISTGALFAVVTVLVNYYLQFDWEDAYFKYYYSIVDISFVIMAVCCYSTIFHKLKASQRKLSGNNFFSLFFLYQCFLVGYTKNVTVFENFAPISCAKIS